MATTQPCFICMTEVPVKDLILVDCGHRHCSACLKRNFDIALGTNPFRPVRCCQAVGLSMQNVKQLTDHSLASGISTERLHVYRQKVAEYQTPEKLYCYVRTCSTFIPPALRGSRKAVCWKCKAKMCQLCRAKFHFGFCDPVAAGKVSRVKGIPQETPELMLFKLARRMGWKRCPQCHSMVEKTTGCNHITCNCGCEFCYRCGRMPWNNHPDCAM